ncbi:hypothetical protein EHQ12_09160 [Leptospira gomenensis]|uniref:Uncharacterized protein n=1 Tax=Leptospira gomenensis TaxID=2484974 RepID=A0A5F1YEF0_9LEPT|nr:hypothetical protein [Leptospira gomenensis]TGK37514.1 hypothetical protein EHQ17_02895 [Leptospira gomenensis]TGK39480.1 hypothetical protein EHQ12_09160 [Leptospira gomenensis]TGK43098.1 hypothetical protein EHQ07_13190 [Leptospira gomenensis]TGK55073.1 hypothetical protein EHQ13_18020 [Leptospira gomenensis]
MKTILPTNGKISRIFFSAIFLLTFQSCIAKPSGEGLLDTYIFSNFFSISLTPLPLNVNVSGMSGGLLVLQDQNSQTLNITSNGNFSFRDPIQRYSFYDVSILNQPIASPEKICSITNPSGILTPFFSYVEVVCATKTYPLSVNVFGIASSSSGRLQIRSGNTDVLDVTSDGTYSFSAQIPDQSAYSLQILGSPENHTCQFETVASSSGTMVSPGIAVNVNCLSVIVSTPVDQTVLKPADNIDLTFSKEVAGCNLEGTDVPTGNLKFSHPASNLGFTAIDKVRISSGGAWAAGLNRYVRITGCFDPNTGKQFNNGNPLVFTYTVANEVKYVTTTGAPAGTCDLATPCSSIRYAINQCAAVPCFVLVAGGTYTVSDNATQRIELRDGVNLLGAFSNDFSQRNSNSFKTTVQDLSPPGNCGATEPTTCAPIYVGAPLATLTANILINQITVRPNPNNAWATGIVFNNLNTTAAFQAVVANNGIEGTSSSAPYSAGTVRSGIAAYNSGPNLLIAYNYVLAGSGNSVSAGILADASEGAIYSNWVNGNSHSGTSAADHSIGILIRNLAGAQTLAVSNNVVNSYQQIGSTGVTAFRTSGILTLNSSSTNLFFLHNTIFGGVGTNDSFGIQQLGSASAAKIANNQVFTNPGATGNKVCMNFTPAPSVNLEVKGNNLFQCTILAKTPLFNSTLCAGNPGPLRNGLCLLDLAPVNVQNFSHPVVFLPPTNPFTFYFLGTNTNCRSVFGGIDPAYPAINVLYQNDLFGTIRTPNVAPAPVPAGSFGYSIGAFEYNGVCL